MAALECIYSVRTGFHRGLFPFCDFCRKLLELAKSQRQEIILHALSHAVTFVPTRDLLAVLACDASRLEPVII